MKNSSQKFNKLFLTSSAVKVSANARVNLIGEHTDYTGGYVLPSLLPFKVNIFLDKNKNNYSAYSEYFDEIFEFNDFIKSKTNNWLDYIKGCLFIFFDENKKLKIDMLSFLLSQIFLCSFNSRLQPNARSITPGLTEIVCWQLPVIGNANNNLNRNYIFNSFTIYFAIPSHLMIGGEFFSYSQLNIIYTNGIIQKADVVFRT